MSIERLLWEQDATGLGELVHRGEVAPHELVDAAIARAEATRPDINAIATPLYDAARALAKTVDRTLPLAGVPFALKDLGIGLNLKLGLVSDECALICNACTAKLMEVRSAAAMPVTRRR